MLPKLFKAWNVTHLVFEKDTDAYPRERDDVVVKAAKKAGVEVVIRFGRTLWDSDDVVAKNGGKPTMSITQLQAAGEKVGPISLPIPAPTKLPDPGEMPVDFDKIRPSAKPDRNADLRAEKETGYKYIAGPKGDFAIETLEELGFPPATTPHRGGETRALSVLSDILENTQYTATFEKPKTSPAQFSPQSTTLLSPFLHFGALSVREFYWRVKDVVDSYGKGVSTPPTSLTGQLLFRDMYFAAQAAIGQTFAQTRDNGYCRFIPWHLPSKRDAKNGLSINEHHVDSEDAEEWFQRWKMGNTGFPWIDALMRQLRHEGWIHHLGRHSVACFLTRGGCYVDWERGADVFEEFLLDHEPACNAGNWQWLSCTAFFSQYFKCYSPISFGQKWDKNGDLIREWVPELKNMNAKYIYEPWKAPIQDQKRAGVRIASYQPSDAETNSKRIDQSDGMSHYPKPMFDFAERRKTCLAAMKTAYDVGFYGNDKRVLDGSWRDLFPSGAKQEMQGQLESDEGEHADSEDEHSSTADKRQANPAIVESQSKRRKM